MYQVIVEGKCRVQVGEFVWIGPSGNDVIGKVLDINEDGQALLTPTQVKDQGKGLRGWYTLKLSEWGYPYGVQE
jgi:hypothetical protein